MKKLFIFGIGGTGSRVIKSLAFLLGSGINLRDDYEIVPIIVDPHITNANLLQTKDVLTYYSRIRKSIGENQGFFSTKISTLKSFSENEGLPDTFVFRLGNTANQRFKDYLQYDALSNENKALVKTLFSDEHLNTEMDIGFVGNPHMGSVVLNQFKKSIEFKAFANSFHSGDRIFIVGSIFGGTGAAGFPLILKNIRRADENPELANKELLKNAPIGGLCVQPYFNVDTDNESSIQRSDWMIKTKSAFNYYKKTITKQDAESINAMYYLADDVSGKSYKNDPGENGQNNPSHFIEMVGAMSIIDFINTPDSELKTENGKPFDAYAKEFGVLENQRVLDFSHLGENSRNLISKPMSQLFFATKYLLEGIDNSKDQAFMKNEPKLDASFFTSPFYSTYLIRFIKMYRDWLFQMEDNIRGFKPFNLDASLPESINNLSADKGLFKRKLTYTKFNDYLNEIESEESKKYGDNPSVKILDLLSKATESIMSNYFNSIN